MDKQKISEWIEDPLEDLIGNDDDKALELELSDRAKKLYPGPQVEEPDWSAKLDVDFEPDNGEDVKAAGGEWIPGIKNKHVIYGGAILLGLLIIRR
jgi:hypothetical protein